MNRKNFLRTSLTAGAGLVICKDLFAKNSDPVYGHNGMRYRMNKQWGQLDAGRYPVRDCHEMVMDKKGRILLLGNDTSNNVLVYNKSGKLLEAWGHQFPGAHGLTIADENGEQYLFITDTDTHQVFKTTMDGKILLTIDAPLESGLYTSKEQFKPTEVTVGHDGQFYVADGYGEQYVLRYDGNGKLLSWFGGKGEGEQHLDNAHGITIDGRNKVQTLLVTDRTRNCFKRFQMDGQYIETISLPGACVCRPVIRNEHLYAAVLRSPDLSAEGSGFVTVLNKENKVVSNIGGTEPSYVNGVLQKMAQKEKIFVHPHDVCVDDDDNLYVAQWASGKVYPYKFTRV